MRFPRKHPVVSRIAVVALLLMLAVVGATYVRAQAQSPAGQGAVSPAPATPSKQSAQYVGADTCAMCHDDIAKGLKSTRHWENVKKLPDGAEAHACETCHGPGAEHVENGGDKTKIFRFTTATAKEVNSRCLQCHSASTEHMNFSRSAHSENNLSCVDCHSPHHPKTDQFLLVKVQPELCYTCHAKAKGQFNLPFHHRVEEGLLQCTDCHNPHGSFLVSQLRSAAARDSVCFTCHVDKQGPFVFEHPGVKTEGCVSCHSPHGSPNPRLLKASNLNVFCLKCHTASTFSSASGTPDFHNQAAQFQACTICHVAIHGSNFDRHLLK